MDPIPINYGPWLSMSDEGLAFIQSLMLRDPNERLSAAKALEHPWFTRQFEDAGLKPNPSCSRSQQCGHDTASAAADSQEAERNNIVPLAPQQQQPQQQHLQQQHQHLQSHGSLPFKHHAVSM